MKYVAKFKLYYGGLLRYPGDEFEAPDDFKSPAAEPLHSNDFGSGVTPKVFPKKFKDSMSLSDLAQLDVPDVPTAVADEKPKKKG